MNLKLLTFNTAGLSYITFEYTNLRLSCQTIKEGKSLLISVNVKNTGARAGKEVVMLFSSGLYASITQDVKRLRRFEKMNLTGRRG